MAGPAVKKVMPPTSQTRSGSEAGIALVAVLWALAVLSLLAMVFSESVQMELRSATYAKDAARAHALACGAIEALAVELAYPRREDEVKSVVLSWERGQRRGQLVFEPGTVELEVVNESGKLDVNLATEEQLARLFEAREVEPALARQMAVAILHWRSPASANPESTALEGYYGARGERPRHGAFVSVEELLRVRGMTREILYGTVVVSAESKLEPKYGLAENLTVRSRSVAVNVNYASEFTLRGAPGVSAAMAQAIIRERQREPFKTVTEISQRLPFSLPDEALPFLTTAETDTYTIHATGLLEGSPVRRSVAAVVQLVPTGRQPYRVVAWYDDPVHH